MPEVKALSGIEILDSRGRPTVKAYCTLASGVVAQASVPSGASTGAAEAVELRDQESRYRGLGCRKAVANLNEIINDCVSGCDFPSQAGFDAALIALDGTQNKSRLGANAILAASLAFARASALEANEPLYQHFSRMLPGDMQIPRPTINLFSGGKHAGAQVEIQDVLIMPQSPDDLDSSLAMFAEIYACAAELCAERYDMRLLRADEGGLAPPASSAESLIELALAAIDHAGLRAGTDVVLAVDVASSHFFDGESYHLGGRRLSPEEMIQRLVRWVNSYPIVSIEDGLAEDDWQHWPRLRETLGHRALILGDDLLCTNPARIRKAVETQAANALLLKVNQIGTLTEAAEAVRLARVAGWRIVASARSGETEDDWLADLAVGWGADQIKIGSITQSERLSKYNRLLEITAAVGWPLARP
ncbi:MAG: phosphopyruvate hydratase [Anaerolineae bacterium]|nr:phosphopyruvate hydratase [Anaerolineae bacterium]